MSMAIAMSARLALAASLSAVALLSACGPAQAASSVAGRAPAPVWGAVGDSITWGWGTTTQTFGNGVVNNPNAYPARAGVTAVGMPAQCLTATDCGFGDWDSTPLVSTFTAELATLKTHGVTAVVVESGVNDLPQNITDRQYLDAYRLLISTGSAYGTRVVLSTITPRSGLTAAQEAQRERVNTWIRGRVHVDYAAALGGNTLLPAYDSGDGLHPSDAGHARMAERLSAFIASHPKMRTHTLVCVRAPCGGGR